MGKTTPRWTDKEIQFMVDELREGGLAPQLIAKRLRRSKMSVYHKMRELGLRHIRKARVWTPERIALLVEMWERGDSINGIAHALSINPSTVLRKTYELDLESRPMMTAKVAPTMEKPGLMPWPDLGPNAFQDVKVGKDVQFRQNRPQDRTLGGVGQTW